MLKRYFTLRTRIRQEISNREAEIENIQINRYKNIGSREYIERMHRELEAKAIIKTLKELL